MPIAAETLSKLAIFSSLTATEAASFDQLCTFSRPAQGDWILDEASPDQDVYFVLSGSVRAVSHTARQTLIFTDMDAGSFFGELAAIDGQPRSVSVFALEPSVLARMPQPVFMETLFVHRSLGLAVMRTLAARVRSLTRRVSELTTLDVRHRLYSELLRSARRDFSDPARAIVSPPPNQSDFAARIGAQRETVSREFKGMEQIGLIERRRGALVLRDVVRLSTLIEQAMSR